MDKKKGKVILGILVMILILGGAIYYTFCQVKQKQEEPQKIEEYTPQEEISDEQLRQTMVTLYFVSKETEMVASESRTIDAKQLVENPYATIVTLLVEGPQNSELRKVIPEGTKINKVERKGDCVYVDFSTEFVNGAPEGEEEEKKIIYSIVQSLTELKEVNRVKILIDGDTNSQFKDGKITFKTEFTKEK